MKVLDIQQEVRLRKILPSVIKSPHQTETFWKLARELFGKGAEFVSEEHAGKGEGDDHMCFNVFFKQPDGSFVFVTEGLVKYNAEYYHSSQKNKYGEPIK